MNVPTGLGSISGVYIDFITIKRYNGTTVRLQSARHISRGPHDILKPERGKTLFLQLLDLTGRAAISNETVKCCKRNHSISQPPPPTLSVSTQFNSAPAETETQAFRYRNEIIQHYLSDRE
jgi:hypothetical protein